MLQLATSSVDACCMCQNTMLHVHAAYVAASSGLLHAQGVQVAAAAVVKQYRLCLMNQKSLQKLQGLTTAV